ncbi:MAG: hypothetical protein ACXWBP_08355, partial [Limisphaerales bacterium]
ASLAATASVKAAIRPGTVFIDTCFMVLSFLLFYAGFSPWNAEYLDACPEENSVPKRRGRAMTPNVDTLRLQGFYRSCNQGLGHSFPKGEFGLALGESCNPIAAAFRLSNNGAGV